MSYDEEYKYDDMIDMPHHVSSKHPHMPLLDRAAQFSPFAALTGHDAAIKETARLTEERIELDENSKEELNMRLQFIREHLAEHPKVTLTYFKPDEKKAGGSYVTITGKVKKIDMYEHRIFLEDGTAIWMEDLVAVREV